MAQQVERFTFGKDPGDVAVSLNIGTSLTFDMLATLDNDKEIAGTVMNQFNHSYQYFKIK